jgi:hypothetical protein
MAVIFKTLSPVLSTPCLSQNAKMYIGDYGRSHLTVPEIVIRKVKQIPNTALPAGLIRRQSDLLDFRAQALV